MTTPWRQAARVIAICIAVAACHTAPPQLAETSTGPVSEWPAALAESSREAAGGHYALADKILSDFSARYAATSESTESMFWRALYKMDPANTGIAPRDAILLLDSYLQTPHAAHRSEGTVLRRVAAQLDARATPATVNPPTVPPPIDKAKDEELLRLKDELAKTTAELERIKRRLAAPKP